MLGNRARILWNDCVSENKAVLNNCGCIMNGAAHPPSPHCTSSKTSCWEGGGFIRHPDASAPTGRRGLIWLVTKNVPPVHMQTRHLWLRAVVWMSLCLRVRMKGTSLASIFSDLDSYPSDNESVRAGHMSAVLKCELFKKAVWCNREQRLVWERQFCAQMSRFFPEANQMFPEKSPVWLLVGKAPCKTAL